MSGTPDTEPAGIRLGISDLASALCWPPNGMILVVWVYFDESGLYDPDSRALLRMAIGGCVSTAANWEKLEVEWRAALSDEGLSHFHMVDFEAWKGPFDFRLPSGGRDKERHNRVLNRFLDIMIAHIQHCYGSLSHKIPNDGSKAHQAAMEQCSVGAISYAVTRVWEQYRTPIHLVYAKQRHYPEIGRKFWQEYFDPDDSRISSRTEADANLVPQLQAADVFSYEILRRTRLPRPIRYPYKRLLDGITAKGGKITYQLGPWWPFREREDFPGYVGRVPGQPR